MEAKLARIEAAIESLRREEYKAQDIARAGAFVYLARDGAVRVERGFVRPEDEPQTKKANGKDHAQEPAGPAPLSEKLIAEMTAYRYAPNGRIKLSPMGGRGNIAITSGARHRPLDMTTLTRAHLVSPAAAAPGVGAMSRS